MDGDAPVLTNRKEIKVWKSLKALERSAAKGSKKNTDKLRRIIQGVLDTEGYANPMIVVKIIDLVDIYLTDEMQNMVVGILEKCKLTDCAPQLQAAEKLINIGSYVDAKSILDRMTVISDVPQWEYLRGMIEAHEGNNETAYRHFMRVYELDDNYLSVYANLDQLEPDKGWFYRGLIASVRNDEPTNARAGSIDGRFGELYNAYQAWSTGGRANVIDSVKRMVREGIETDIELALARFYFDEGKYFESAEHYQKAAESGIYFIKMELIEAYLRSGSFESASKVCSELDQVGISDRRLIGLQLRTATLLKNRADVVKYVKIYLYNDYADYNAYVDCVNSYIGLRMHSEASSLLEDMSKMDSDDPMINLLSSKNDYASGRYPSARITAKKAVRKMPDNPDCLLHISRVYMSMKRPEKALRYIDTILKDNDRNKDALLLKKDVYMSMTPPDYESACRQCEKIIAHSNDDSETWRDYAALLSKMGRDKDSLDAYRRSLNIKDDPILFMDIITSLARTERYDDLIDLTNEYDDIYGGNVDMWAIKGNAEYQSGNFDDAIESYTKAVSMDTNNPAFWHSKGMAEEMAGEFDLAEVSYDKAVLMDLDNSEYWISKAAVQEKKGDYSGAINSLNRVISTHPENVYSLMRKAMILVRLGKNNEARTFIELASKIEPLNMKIMIARRDVYYREGDTESTKAVCKSILAMTPGDKKTAIILARMHFRTGNLDEARSVLVAFSVEDSGFTDEDYEILHMLREIYHTQGKTHEEISTCKTILSFKPDDRDTKSALAEAYIKKGMIDAAKALYDELHLQSPEDSDFSLKKAKMAEDKDTALSVLMESLTTDPDNKDVLLEVARMLYEDGKLKDSLIYANRAIQADPTDSAPYVRKIMIYFDLCNYRGVLDVADEASGNVRVKDPIIWKYSGDSQMILGDYSNALILYDTAMKLGMSTRDIYHSRGMCQEVSEMYDAAINSYTIAYQKDPTDTDSMMRVAAIHLLQERDQSALRVLDQAINADPLLSEAIIAKATILASRGKEDGVKRLFDHCVSNGVDEDTKQMVAELMEKARTREVVAMPVIPLVMPTAPAEYYEEPEPEEEPVEEQTDEESADVSEPEEGTDAEEEALQEETGSEEPLDDTQETDASEQESEESAEEGPEEEPEEEDPLQNGFVVDDDSDMGFVVVSAEDEGSAEEGPEEEPEEEKPVTEESEIQEEPQTIEADEEEPEVTVEQEAEQEPEQEPAEEKESDEEEPIFVVADDSEDDEDSLTIEVPEEEPVAAEGPEEEISEDGKSVKEYAKDVLEYARRNGDITDEENVAQLAGVPAEKADAVIEYLSDIPEYGRIDPSDRDFKEMERLSYEAVVGAGADDIEKDPVISITSAFFQSGANDIEVAKRLVAYVYEAMTCDIDKDAVYDSVSEIADDVEFNGRPSGVFDIMSKYRIGVYSARAVKAIVFNDDGSVISHI